MRDHVTVVPSDQIITVDGSSLLFSFAAPRNMHAVQWHYGSGHIEYAGHKEPNRELAPEDYSAEVAPFVALWEAEKARLDKEARLREEEAGRPPTLEEARAAKLAAIDRETSAAILVGFDFGVDGRTLHFSYDGHDQQNFADTANAATLARLGLPGLPPSVTWNGWEIMRDEEGRELSRSLVRLSFDPDSFLALYLAGALAHKATQMEAGGLRKAAAESAASLEELEAV